MNEFVSWCRHILVSFLFHALTSLHPPSFHRNDFSTCSNTLAYFIVTISVNMMYTNRKSWRKSLEHFGCMINESMAAGP